MRNTSSFIVVLLLLLSSCSKPYTENPVDTVIKEVPTGDKFTLILHDMDVSGSFIHEYHHQYKVIIEREGVNPREEITPWFSVSKNFFMVHQYNMGMELAHRGEDGKLEKEVAPPGYSNYVGNEKYGHWVESNGSSFWQFYGQWMFMNTMFHLVTNPVRRSYYRDYRDNYYGRGTVYYGPRVGGGYFYGTSGSYNKSTRPTSTWSSSRSTFKNRVNTRTSRSSSRFGSYSSRSSSGGFGK